MNLTLPRYQPDLPLKVILKSLVELVYRGNRIGDPVIELEALFARDMGVSQAIAISSVRFGLYHTIKYCRFPSGAEILCSPITIYPVIECIIAAGMKPVFVDLTSDNFSINIDDAAKKTTPRARAILATHLWGIPNKMGEIYEFAKRRRLELFEDASQCMRGASGGYKVGSFGRAGFFSMGVTKTANAFGGAMMITGDDDLADYMRSVISALRPAPVSALLKPVLLELALNICSRRTVFSFAVSPALSLAAAMFKKKDRLDHSGLQRSERRDIFPEKLNYAFSDIQARAAISTFKNLFIRDNKRKKIADWYRSALRGTKGLHIPAPAKGDEGNYWMFVVFVRRPEEFKKFLLRMKIDSLIPSLDACHEMSYFEEFIAELPVASKLSRSAVCLPCYNSIRREDAERVIAAVKGYFNLSRDNDGE